jgi:hypothetical protein
MNLSKHFTLEELTFSQTAARLGIDNTPDPDTLSNLRGLSNFLEVIREKIKRPIYITSGYRGNELNKQIGGSKTSAHMSGLAADIISPSYGTPADLAEVIAALDLEFDQLILEFGKWVHVSVSENPRGQMLTAINTSNGVKYKPGLVDWA